MNKVSGVRRRKTKDGSQKTEDRRQNKEDRYVLLVPEKTLETHITATREVGHEEG